ncbi:MAG: hypothetical protein ACKOEO_19095, partial [Planctomycetaceae bacterium]
DADLPCHLSGLRVTRHDDVREQRPVRSRLQLSVPAIGFRCSLMRRAGAPSSAKRSMSNAVSG